MEREKVIVCDDKGYFLKIFKEELIEDFRFTEGSLFEESEVCRDGGRTLYVAYDKLGLLEFLKLNKSGINVLVCMFNEHVKGGLCFLEEISNLIKLDVNKTSCGLIEEMKLHFKNTAGYGKQLASPCVLYSHISQVNFFGFNKMLFLFA